MTVATEPELTSRWLPLGAPSGGVRLFCLPHAGGSATAYGPWARRIDGVAVCPVQPPGRESRLRETPYLSMASLVRAVTDVVLGQDDAPYAVYGHSLGALVGFEVLREIRRRGGPGPEHFFASGCPAPDYDDPPMNVGGMDDEQVVGLLRKMGGTPDWVLADAEVLAMILPPFRADFAVKETYRYAHQAPLSTPITVIGGSRDGQAGLSTMDGWRDQTTSGFRLHVVDGGHFAALQRPDLVHPIIADALGDLR
jgi:medium-chain acyl-[acyl-carrier-protein] hydrolase